MSDTLVLCESCHRHIRASEGRCPFCRTTKSPVASHAVAVIAGVALVGALSHDASAQPINPRLRMEHSPAQGYGAPPHSPFEPGQPQTVERAPGVSFAVSGPSSVARVSFDRNVGAASEAIRASLSARMPAIERCMGRGPRGRASGPSQSLVMVPWGAITLPVRPGQRDAVSQCVYNAVRAALPRAARGQGAMVSVRVEFTPTANTIGGPPAPGASRCPPDVNRGCRRTGCPDGMVCDTRAACVPSTCGCDPATGNVTCTDDCGGGVCVPRERAAQPSSPN